MIRGDEAIRLALAQAEKQQEGWLKQSVASVKSVKMLA